MNGFEETKKSGSFFARLLAEEQEREEKEKQQRLREQQEYQERLRRQREQILTLRRREESQRYFLESEGFFCHDRRGNISSREVYDLYQQWCDQYDVVPQEPRSLWYYMKKHAAQYNIIPTNGLYREGRTVRGFKGIRPLTQEERNPADA